MPVPRQRPSVYGNLRPPGHKCIVPRGIRDPGLARLRYFRRERGRLKRPNLHSARVSEKFLSLLESVLTTYGPLYASWHS